VLGIIAALYFGRALFILLAVAILLTKPIPVEIHQPPVTPVQIVSRFI
jgi:hypothetical protein